MSSEDPSPLDRLNALPPPAARRELLACCASRTWAGRVEVGPPYPDAAALAGAGDAIITELSWADIVEALAAHPADRGAGRGEAREAAWSRREQSGGAPGADEATRCAWPRRTGPYEEPLRPRLPDLRDRPDRRRDAGRGATQRLGNDEATERAVVRGELRRRSRRLRLERLAAGHDASPPTCWTPPRASPPPACRCGWSGATTTGWAGRRRAAPTPTGGCATGCPTGGSAGTYRLIFDTAGLGRSFFPEVTVAFASPSPAGTTTCRCC